MGISGYSILAGLLGGAGGAMTGVGNAFEQQRLDAMKQQQIDIEKQRADQAMELQQNQLAQQAEISKNTLAQNQNQFEAGRFTDVPASSLPASYMGGQQPDAQGNVRVQTSILPDIRKTREDEQLQGRYQALGSYLRSRAGSPATAEAPMSPEGSMYSEQATIPGAPAVAARPVDPNDLVSLLAGIPGGADLAKALVPSATSKFGIHGGNAAGSPTVIYNQQTGEVAQNIPGVDPMKPKYTTNTINTQEGVFREVVDERGQVVARERVGSPVQQPQQPQQPNAAMLYKATLEKYQQARDLYGEEDQRTKDLATLALGLRSQVSPETGSRIETPKAVDPLKQAIADKLAGRPGPGPGITNPVAAPSGAMKNGKSLADNMAVLQQNGRTPDQARQEIARLQREGKL